MVSPDATEELVEKATDLEADLLVSGRSDSLAERVLRRASCDVLVVQ